MVDETHFVSRLHSIHPEGGEECLEIHPIKISFKTIDHLMVMLEETAIKIHPLGTTNVMAIVLIFKYFCLGQCGD